MGTCREKSFKEALASCGSEAWSLQYSRHHPLVATAAAAISSDQQKQHMQQLPWKNVVPMLAPAEKAAAAACGGSTAEVITSSSRSGENGKQQAKGPVAGASRHDQNSSKASHGASAAHATVPMIAASARSARITLHDRDSSGSSTSAMSGCDGAVWWEVNDELCDFCSGRCAEASWVVCEVCEVAQYCSVACRDGAVAGGKHPWAGCRALAAVKSGRLGKV